MPKTRPQTGSTEPWWRTAPNPPCELWCVEDHEPDEFARGGGGMLCSSFPFLQLVGKETHEGVIRVEVQRNQSVGTNRRTLEKQPAHVHLVGVGVDDELTGETAQLLGAALLAAGAFVRAVQS